MLAGNVQDAAEDDLSQFVSDGFEKAGFFVRMHRRSVALPVEYQAVFVGIGLIRFSASRYWRSCPA